jgi:isopentenyl-diphosphate delta-isomerase
MMMIDSVVLVNEFDEDVGPMEKMEAHRRALLHRAFSVFIFNESGDMLLQRRALTKYHSGGLWTNACCSHPRPGEAVMAAATRRLQEELGFVSPLKTAFTFTYKAPFDNGLTEYEFDHVFFGQCSETPNFNTEEVMELKWIDWPSLLKWVAEEPDQFTPWFRIVLPLVVKKVEQIKISNG